MKAEKNKTATGNYFQNEESGQSQIPILKFNIAQCQGGIKLSYKVQQNQWDTLFIVIGYKLIFILLEQLLNDLF